MAMPSPRRFWNPQSKRFELWQKINRFVNEDLRQPVNLQILQLSPLFIMV